MAVVVEEAVEAIDRMEVVETVVEEAVEEEVDSVDVTDHQDVETIATEGMLFFSLPSINISSVRVLLHAFNLSFKKKIIIYSALCFL